MNSIRIKFIRGEEVKFISHLDLMKTVERAIRRASIPIAYSQGFNPHPQMVFGLPLSVGVTSEAEYADFELSKPMSPKDFVKTLNGSLPNGLTILNAREKKVKDNIMASVRAARYDILLCADEILELSSLRKNLGQFMDENEIIVKKETKKGCRDINIRPMILKIDLGDLSGKKGKGECGAGVCSEYTTKWILNHKLDICNNVIKPTYNIESIFCISVLLSAGSADNLKPELLVSGLENFMHKKFKTVKIHRTELFVGNNEGIFEPLEDKVLVKSD